jgi:hypothetical protein
VSGGDSDPLVGGSSTSALGFCMTGKRKFLTIAAKERNSVVWVFLLVAATLPGLFGAWRFLAARVELSTSFAVILALRLLIPLLTGGMCVFILWKRKTTLSSRIFGLGILWAGLWFGFVATFILVTGHVPSKYHPNSVSREESVPYFVGALTALAVGAAVVLVGRRTSLQKPNDRWRVR